MVLYCVFRRWRRLKHLVRKRYLLATFYLKTIILPRQAQDKHREALEKNRFLTEGFLKTIWERTHAVPGYEDCCGMDILMDTMARWEDPALPRQYAAMQILVKHKGSKMTQSNRDPTGEAAAAASPEGTLLFLKIAPIRI